MPPPRTTPCPRFRAFTPVYRVTVYGCEPPEGSGLGGIAGLVVWHEGKTSSFDGSTRAPLASRPEMFELVGGAARSGMYGWPAVKNDANVEGPLSVTVPGAVAAYDAAHRRPGKP